ncbi:MAG: putative Selenoprotein [Acidobacteria bacterium]|nr:putative Selenoprotein [Acidobacteriota bacterium]
MRGSMKIVLYCLNILRQVLGEGEYERYCTHMRKKHPGVVPADPREFYATRLEEKYSRPQRCC